MKSLEIDPEKTKKQLVGFIKTETEKAGFNRVIFGLSGGLDSATVAYLCAEALGKENVYAVLMPYKTVPKNVTEDAERIVKEIGINSQNVDITKMIDSYFEIANDGDRLRRGNKMARERMSILYDMSLKYKALVIGTSNKSELLLGYGTIYGDTACAIMPLAGLYKTQVRQLAGFLGVPDNIINKVPSADLWPGQTDEGEMGFTYEEADKLLYLMIDCKKKKSELVKAGFDAEFIDKIELRVKKMEFKRRLPLIPKTI